MVPRHCKIDQLTELKLNYDYNKLTGEYLNDGVSMVPGQRQATLIPFATKSVAKALEKPMTAAFVAP